jgi:hypothetical protein
MKVVVVHMGTIERGTNITRANHWPPMFGDSSTSRKRLVLHRQLKSATWQKGWSFSFLINKSDYEYFEKAHERFS